MPFFRRKPDRTSGDIGILLLEGQDMIDQTAQAHRGRWGLGDADRWDLDQTTGVLRWTFPDRVAEAPAQALASFSPRGGTWMWAWANESLLPHLRTASESVREWGEAHGQPMFTTARMELTEEQAADLTALAFRISGATGFYRAPTGPAYLYLTFGPVTVVGDDGHQETFTIDVG